MHLQRKHEALGNGRGPLLKRLDGLEAVVCRVDLARRHLAGKVLELVRGLDCLWIEDALRPVGVRVACCLWLEGVAEGG
jgi:hypothetical protein